MKKRSVNQVFTKSIAGLCCLFVLSGLYGAAFQAAVGAQTASPANPQSSSLVIGQQVDGILAAGERVRYRLAVKAGQFAEISLTKSDAALAVRLLEPNQQVSMALSKNDWNTSNGSSLVWLAQVSGDYLLELHSTDTANLKDLRVGYYATLETLRDAQAADNARLTAYASWREVCQLNNSEPQQSHHEKVQQVRLKYDEALNQLRRAQDPLAEARLLREIAWFEFMDGHVAKAREMLKTALAAFQQLKQPQEIARTMSHLGQCAYRDALYQEAHNYLDQALQLFATVADPRWQRLTFARAGWSLRLQGELEKAIEMQNRCLLITRSFGDQEAEISTLYEIGRLYQLKGDRAKALDFYQQSLRLPQLKKYPKAEYNLLNQLSNFYANEDQLQKALDFIQRALAALNTDLSHSEDASLLNNLGSLYRRMGDVNQAVTAFQRAVLICQQTNDEDAEIDIQGNLGVTYKQFKAYPQSLACFQRAMELCQRRNEPKRQARISVYLGSLHDALNDDAKASAAYQQAIAFYEQTKLTTVDKAQYGMALLGIAATTRRNGNAVKAVEYGQRALQIHQELNQLQVQINDLTELTRAYLALNNWTLAESTITAAIAVANQLREQLVNPMQSAGTFSLNQGPFAFYLDMLMTPTTNAVNNANNQIKALQIAQEARARSLLSMLAEAKLNLREGVGGDLLEKERSLRAQFNRKAAEKTKLLNNKAPAEQIKAVTDALNTLSGDLNFVENQLRTNNPRYASLTLPAPLTTAEVQGLLDDDTLLLEYAFGEQGAYLWVITPGEITSYTLNASRSEIQRAAYRLYQTFAQQPKGTTATAAPLASSELSQFLLAPLAGKLAREWRNKRLVIVAPEVLQFIPFGALSLPAARPLVKKGATVAPLLEQHEIVSLPSAASLAFLRKGGGDRQPVPQTLAIFADPVFAPTDGRVKAVTVTQQSAAPAYHLPTALMQRAVRSVAGTERADLQRLPFSRDEAEAIAAIAPAGSVLKALDFQASRATVLSDKLAEYRIVHFATHGLLDSTQPELSGLALSLVDEQGKSQDGYLRLNEIYNLKLNAELVVLSACQTGLGKEVKGEGLIGLTRGFMYAGAPRVVASLWQVNDAATAELMKRFYRGMLKEKLRPAAALRQAQLELMKKPAWRSPYYWGAFVLQGEWK